jgi:hypothetical protein
MTLGEPQQIGDHAVAPALRLSAFSNDVVSTLGLRRRLAKAQRPEASAEHCQRAHQALDEVLRPSGMCVETFMVATDKHRLENIENLGSVFVAKEVAYPKLGQRRMRNFEDDASEAYVAKALQESDVKAYAGGLNILGDYPNKHPTHMGRLGSPDIFMPPQLSHSSYRPNLDQIMEKARGHQEIVVTLGDMLLNDCRPVRELPVFRQLSV